MVSVKVNPGNSDEAAQTTHPQGYPVRHGACYRAGLSRKGRQVERQGLTSQNRQELERKAMGINGDAAKYLWVC